MAIPPTAQLFPRLRSELTAAGFTRRTDNVWFRDHGRFREFVQFQRDRYSTPQRVGVLVNVAAIDLDLWAHARTTPRHAWLPELPESPDYPELDTRELGWRDRPDLDFTSVDSEALTEQDAATMSALVADGLRLLEQRRVDRWNPPRRPFTGLP